MDWTTVASVLGERLEQPLVLLDGQGHVRMLNQSMEQVIGWSRFELEGQSWSSFCSAPGAESEAERWIASALRGALRNYDVTMPTKDAQRVALRFEFLLVGSPPNQGLLMTAVRVTPVQSFQLASARRDLDYVISIINSSFGSLVRLCVGGEAVPLRSREERCYRLIYGQQQPCENCPILEAGNVAWPRTVIRQQVDQAPKKLERSFEITTVDRVDASLVRVRVRSIPDKVVDAIHRERIDELARRAQLSPREREVLDYLLLGRSVEDMAKLLGISPRTVKFHQAHALQKLGAESRSDLIRLIL